METGKSLKDLAAEMPLYPQVMINVPAEHPKKLAKNPDLMAAAKTVDETLGDDGRVLIRPSGTEPKLRVMVEAKDGDLAKQYAEQLVKQVKSL